MTAPKTWLSAIVREDGLYVQAFIFSCDNGYIANSSIVLTNKETNESATYQMSSGDETCLFKYINKLTPEVSTNYSIQLVVNAYIYSESDIITFLDTVDFTTPDSWGEDIGGSFDVTIEPIVAVGNLSTKPTIRSVVSGGNFEDGTRLRICAANSLSNTLDYNSFDAMADFAVEDGVYAYNNIFSLGVSGKWYFKAFLTLTNNEIIATSNTVEYNVNQGDIVIQDLTVDNNVSTVESGTEYVFNQIVDGERVGIASNSTQSGVLFQLGDLYHFSIPNEMSLANYIAYYDGVKSPYRIPTMAELEEYTAIKDTLVGWQDMVSLKIPSNESNEYGNRGFSFSSGAPINIDGAGSDYSLLLLRKFENKLDAPVELNVPVMKSATKLQDSGYKVTDFVKKSELDELRPMDYKVITGFISQSDTSEPSIAIIKNYLGSDLICTRSDTGTYNISGDAGTFDNTVYFPQEKVILLGANDAAYYMSISKDSDRQLTLCVIAYPALSGLDDALENVPFELRVYKNIQN